MNALAYFGQQTIQAGVASGANATIDSQTAMNGITYSVNADPLANEGTWAKWTASNGKNPMI